MLRYSSNLCPSCCLQQKMISTRGKVQGAVCIACYGCGAECVSHVRIICGWRYYFMTSSVKPLKHYGKKLGVNISSCSKITYVLTALSSKTDIMKETEQDLSLVFQNCPSPTQTNFTNSSGRLEDHNDLRTELSSLAIHQPDRPDRGRN